jgi:hypothetical protein
MSRRNSLVALLQRECLEHRHEETITLMHRIVDGGRSRPQYVKLLENSVANFPEPDNTDLFGFGLRSVCHSNRHKEKELMLRVKTDRADASSKSPNFDPKSQF